MGAPSAAEHARSREELDTLNELCQTKRELAASQERERAIELKWQEEMRNVARLEARCTRLASDSEYRREFRGQLPPRPHYELGARCGTPVSH